MTLLETNGCWMLLVRDEEGMVLVYSYINQILNQKMLNSMNKESLSSLNKISLEMDRLSSLINKQQKYHNQLQSLLRREDSNESSVISNFDEYFKEYDNPTTKSLPIDDDSHITAHLDQDTQIIDGLYHHSDSEEEDKENLHDDKSTVILNTFKQPFRREHEHPVSHLHAHANSQTHNIAKPSINCYASLNQESRNSKKDLVKGKKSTPKNPTASMPSEAATKERPIMKNSSISRHPTKLESPLGQPCEANLMRDLKGKLSKVSKIDREELTRLQEKKLHKKTQLSSNRKKTKRQLAATRSTANIPQKSTHPLPNKPHHSNASKIDAKKKESLKRTTEERGLSTHDWQKTGEKAGKKLNRVNICKLQENMKKNHDKKSQIKQPVRRPQEKKTRKQQQRRELKLHFTDSDESPLRRLIDEKNLTREYARETDKYLQALRRINKPYFETLIRECRETSEEAVFKLKLVTLLLYFFDQFAVSSLLSDHRRDQGSVGEEEVIDVLLHPKRVVGLMQDLPNTLMGDNTVSSQRTRTFCSKFEQINEQLDQELQFFLIKKSPLFMFVHALQEYVNFLLQKELVAQTNRTRLRPLDSQQKLQGYYSSRSKRDHISKKCIKRTVKANKLGFRCDSDRKITLEDEDLFLRGALAFPTKNTLKKAFK